MEYKLTVARIRGSALRPALPEWQITSFILLFSVVILSSGALLIGNAVAPWLGDQIEAAGKWKKAVGSLGLSLAALNLVAVAYLSACARGGFRRRQIASIAILNHAKSFMHGEAPHEWGLSLPEGWKSQYYLPEPYEKREHAQVHEARAILVADNSSSFTVETMVIPTDPVETVSYSVDVQGAFAPERWGQGRKGEVDEEAFLQMLADERDESRRIASRLAALLGTSTVAFWASVKLATTVSTFVGS